MKLEITVNDGLTIIPVFMMQYKHGLKCTYKKPNKIMFVLGKRFNYYIKLSLIHFI